GRVGHLAVDGDDVPAGGAERGERLAVGLARRDLAAHLVAGQLERAVLEPVRLARLGLRDLDDEVGEPAELLDRGVRVGQRLAVPAFLVLDRLDALALDRPGDDHGRPAAGRRRLRVRGVDLLDVVTVDLDRVPAEGAGALDVAAQVPAVHRFATLPEPVHVENGGQVVEAVVAGVLERLPDRALGRLAV